MINYYIGQTVQFNLTAKEAQDEENMSLLNMIQTQAQAAGYAFEQEMNALIDGAFPDETTENEGMPDAAVGEPEPELELV